MPVDEFFTGVKRNAPRRPDELIARRSGCPSPTGPQQFAKIGTRNAMVIAVCSLRRSPCIPSSGAVGAGIGSAGADAHAGRATPRTFIAGELDEDGLWDSPGPIPERARRPLRRAGRGRGRAPIDDVRGTAAYRRHAAGGAGPAHARVGVGGLRREDELMRVQRDGQRRARGRSTTSGRARACCTSCASAWACRAPRTPASRASAGRARSTSTATLVCACLVLAGQAEGREVVTVEGLARRRRPPPGPAGVRRGGRACSAGSARPGLVVATHDLLARATPAPTDAGDPRGARRQPVPVHRLREDPRRRAAGRRARWGRHRRERPTR